MKNESLPFNWVTIVASPIIGFLAAVYTPLKRETACFAVIYYFVSGIAITGGYHRLWSHKSYEATLPLKWFLAIFGAACCQWSIRTWAECHRSNHRYTDTDQDPYSVRHGLVHAHIGWVLQPEIRAGPTDLSDLDADPVVRLQHRYYLTFAIIMSFIFPSVVPGLLWGDWQGGFIYAGVIRLFFCYQAIFSINSIAHWLGDQPYDDRHTSRNHTLVALLCFGEGYHNYHHEFPADYRNGVEWYQCDVTKWCIWVWKQLGLAYGLKQAPDNVVGKGTYQQARKKLERESNKLDWGLPLSQLPGITWDGFQEAVKDGRQLIILSEMVYDIATFIPLHPGGVKILVSHIGKDATKAFNGEIYSHSTAARNWLDEFRVGFLCGNGQKLSHVPIPAAVQDSKGKRL